MVGKTSSCEESLPPRQDIKALGLNKGIENAARQFWAKVGGLCILCLKREIEQSCQAKGCQGRNKRGFGYLELSQIRGATDFADQSTKQSATQRQIPCSRNSNDSRQVKEGSIMGKRQVDGKRGKKKKSSQRTGEQRGCSHASQGHPMHP